MHLHVTVIQRGAWWRRPCPHFLAHVWTPVEKELADSLHLLLGSEQNFPFENTAPSQTGFFYREQEGVEGIVFYFDTAACRVRRLKRTDYEKQLASAKQRKLHFRGRRPEERSEGNSRVINFTEWQKLCCFHLQERCMWQDQPEEQIECIPQGGAWKQEAGNAWLWFLSISSFDP